MGLIHLLSRTAGAEAVTAVDQMAALAAIAVEVVVPADLILYFLTPAMRFCLFP